MRTLLLLCLFVIASPPLHADDSCRVIHGRAHLHGSDGQLRIWHIGTHHEYEPDELSWPRVEKWLEAGVTEREKATLASPASMVYLVADFLLCPTEPFRKGAVQRAEVKSAIHRHYVHIKVH